MNTNLGNRIKNLRKERHLSQEYVAEQIGVSRPSVSKWESGVSRPSRACEKKSVKTNLLW